jgi:hypothetical protein
VVRAELSKTRKFDAAGELSRIVQEIERREIVHAADVIAAVGNCGTGYWRQGPCMIGLPARIDDRRGG